MTEHDLSEKKIGELREIAKSQGISSPYKYKKDELIDVILQNFASKEKEEEKKSSNEDRIEIIDIETENLPEKVSEELENMDVINSAEGILELHTDGYGFLNLIIIYLVMKTSIFLLLK